MSLFSLMFRRYGKPGFLGRSLQLILMNKETRRKSQDKKSLISACRHTGLGSCNAAVLILIP